MSEHELWNELGNLYFMSGTYSQAAYAYHRSIQLDSGFGRPYCNLALTYVKQGRYIDAVRLYQRSIELLVDDTEKAITWYRLGDVYRHLKDYRDAIMAYQQADLLDPEISQDRQESDQILYGGSAESADQPLQTQQGATLLPNESVEVVPQAKPLDTQANIIETEAVRADIPAAATSAAEATAKHSEEETQATGVPDVVVDNVVVMVQHEEAQVNTPKLELVGEDDIAVRVGEEAPAVLAAEPESMFQEAAAAEQEVQAQVQGSPPAQLEDQRVPIPPDTEVATLEREPKLVETAPPPLDVEPKPLLGLLQTVAEDNAPTVPDEGLVAESDTLDEPIAVLVKEVTQDERLVEPQRAALTEDLAPEFITLTETVSVREDSAQLGEVIPDITDPGWSKDEYPGLEFEHETEVFIPDHQEEPLDDWLPITDPGLVSTESSADSGGVHGWDLGPTPIEPAPRADGERLDFPSSPLAQERYEADLALEPAPEIDVALEGDHMEAMFIIPEEQEAKSHKADGKRRHGRPTEAANHEKEDKEPEEIEKEIARFKHVVQTNPRNASAWDTLGTLYKSARKYRDAILAYQQAVVVDPSKAPYHHHLGIIYAVEGRDEDAIKAFLEVIEIDPSHSLAHASLGGYYRRMGLDELAQKHIGKAMKNFYNSENEYNRACLEALCGNTEQSIELLRVALKTKQTYVDWVLRDPDLDSIRRDPRFKQLISDYTA